MRLASKHSLSSRFLVYGVGINDSKYIVYDNKTKKHCPFYKNWLRMLRRCYSESYHKTHPTYVGCSVSPEWHLFSTFRSWMMNQKWEGLELDKDLIIKGNRVYGPDACCFVPKSINCLFGGGKKKKHFDLPQNVELLKSGKYRVHMWITPHKRYFGIFSCLKEAHKTALQKKIESVEYHIQSNPELDGRAVVGLGSEINRINNKINNI